MLEMFFLNYSQKSKNIIKISKVGPLNLSIKRFIQKKICIFYSILEKCIELTKLPMVIEKIILWSNNITSKYGVVESAILFESGLNKLCNKIICVEAPEKIRFQRIINRDKINKENIKERLNNQTKLKSHLESIDFFIENIDFDKTKKEVITIHNKLFN